MPLTRLSILLLVSDIVGFILAFNLSYLYAIAVWLGVWSLQLVAILAIQLIILYVMDLYSVNDLKSRFDILNRTAFAVVSAGLVTAGLVYMTEARDIEPLFFRGVLPGGFVLFLLWAGTSRYLATVWMQRVAERMQWLVVTDAGSGSPLCDDITAVKKFGELTILIDDTAKSDVLPESIQPCVAGSFGVFRKVADRSWSGVVIAAERLLPNELLRAIMEMRLRGVRIYDLTEFYEKYMQKVPVRHLKDNWFALSHGFELIHHNTQLKIKRILDLFLAVVFLVLAAPFMLLAALAIKLDLRRESRGPVLYRQRRTGAHGEDFHIYKFRTMVKDAELHGAQWASSKDDRVTPVGGVLRRLRLDEFPQLWNVLKGEMSFVGPRPERPNFNEQLEKEIPYYDLRHLIKPGITGWAQVKYQYGASAEDALEKLQYDLYYIKNYSLLLDLLIVMKTIRVILNMKGR